MVFGDDNLISFSYTATQMMGDRLQKLDLRNPMEIYPQKIVFREFNTNPAQVFTYKQRTQL